MLSYHIITESSAKVVVVSKWAKRFIFQRHTYQLFFVKKRNLNDIIAHKLRVVQFILMLLCTWKCKHCIISCTLPSMLLNRKCLDFKTLEWKEFVEFPKNVFASWKERKNMSRYSFLEHFMSDWSEIDYNKPFQLYDTFMIIRKELMQFT